MAGRRTADVRQLPGRVLESLFKNSRLLTVAGVGILVLSAAQACIKAGKPAVDHRQYGRGTTFNFTLRIAAEAGA